MSNGDSKRSNEVKMVEGDEGNDEDEDEEEPAGDVKSEFA